MSSSSLDEKPINNIYSFNYNCGYHVLKTLVGKSNCQIVLIFSYNNNSDKSLVNFIKYFFKTKAKEFKDILFLMMNVPENNRTIEEESYTMKSFFYSSPNLLPKIGYFNNSCQGLIVESKATREICEETFNRVVAIAASDNDSVSLEDSEEDYEEALRMAVQITKYESEKKKFMQAFQQTLN